MDLGERVMSNASFVPKRSTAASRKPAAALAASLRPEQIAFLGQGGTRSPANGGKATFVQVFCWPLTGTTWASLTKSWATLKALRESSTPLVRIHKGPPTQPSWVYAAVPGLGAPFQDNPAEESTLAAWISRAHVALAMSVVEADARNLLEATPYAISLPECLSGYVDFLKFPGYDPCQLMVAGPMDANEQQRLNAAFSDVQRRVGDAPASRSLAKLTLRVCAPEEVLLPVQFVTLASAAAARFVQAPEAANPIFDAIRPKLVQVPRRIAEVERHRRR
jgi:hypothetical protein